MSRSARKMVLALVMAGAALALATDVPELRCPSNAAEDQCLQHSSTTFTVEGCELRFAYEGDNMLSLQCYNNLQLDSSRAYLPRFTPALHVGNVTLTDCRPVHYATVLAALNVKPTSPLNLELYDTRQTLTAAHFVDLPPLHHLTLQDKGVLHDLPASLDVLTVQDMELPNNILEALPRTLTELRLVEVNITRVPAAVLDLPELRSLRVATDPYRINEVVLERSNASRLQQLYLAGADAALLSEWAPLALEEAKLWYWQAVTPNPLPTCEKLVKLTLYFRNTSSLPARWVARCPRLEVLHITVVHNVSELPAKLLENATQLTNFGIKGTKISSLPAQLFADTPQLTHLDLSTNRLTQLPPRLFSVTPHLTHLNLLFNLLTILQPNLFADIPHLTHLNLEFNFLIILQPNLFADIPHLTHLNLNSNGLTELPAQLFANTPHLTHLELRSNRLSQLPSAVLKLPLLSLDLGFNEFETSVVAEVAAAFTELRSLSLAGNREIGDLCEVNAGNIPGKSPLASLLKLERLELYSTSISLICRDWREDMVNLTYLDLGETKLGNLTYRHLRYKRSVPAVVKLSGIIYFSAHDYDRAAAAAAVAPPSRNVTVIISLHAAYDCSLYWLTNALNSDILPLDDVVIGYGYIMKPALRTVRAEDLLCDRKKTCATVPSGCACGMAGGRLLRVVCVGTKLDRVPQLQSLGTDRGVHAVDLVLSNNSITELTVDDLPPRLRVLDLRNNSISYMTETTAHALVSGKKRRVLLAGNRLECSCRATPALRVLRDHAAVLVGYDALRCEDGGLLKDAVDACSTPALL